MLKIFGILLGLLSMSTFAQYNALETLAHGTRIDVIMTHVEVDRQYFHGIEARGEGKFRYRQDLVQISPAFSNIIPLNLRISDVVLTSNHLELKNIFLEYYNISNLAPGAAFLSCSFLIGGSPTNITLSAGYVFGPTSKVEKKLSTINSAIESAQITVTSSTNARQRDPNYCEIVVGNEYPWMGEHGGTELSVDQSTN